MKRWVFVGLASAALIACGLVHGSWTQRWTPGAESTQAAERLDQLPLTIGDWQGEAMEVKPGQAGASVAGCVQRRYVHRRSGATVVLALVCGRAGPVCVHTPETCYGASGYTVGTPRRVTVSSFADMWTADATRTRATEETRVRIYWGWSDGDGWRAPDNARMTFVQRPVLHKLYVLRELGERESSSKEEACETFLKVLLPQLQRSLFPTS